MRKSQDVFFRRDSQCFNTGLARNKITIFINNIHLNCMYVWH